jgi:K+-transporting ATPase A subunit
MIDSMNYDSLSMTTNIFDFYQQNDATSSSSMMTNEGGGVFAASSHNPFLNKSLTNLISFNSDMSLLDSYFEASLHLIDGNVYF